MADPGRGLKIPRFLIVGPSWVGDMVMAQTLFVRLKQRHPDCLIEVLAPAWCEALLTRMPEVATALTMPVGHGRLALGERWRLARALAKRGYSRAYVLPNSFKSALIPLFAGIPKRIGWRGEMRYGLLNDIRLLDKPRYPLMIQRFIALAEPAAAPLPEPLPRPALRADPAAAATLAGNLGLSTTGPILALCPGAEFGPAKRWPEQHYAHVARHYLQLGWQVWILGSAKDREVGERICAELARDAAPESGQTTASNLAGRTELTEAIDLLALSSAVVANDSGLMHIAAALARPLIVVYGSTSPGFTPPLADAVAALSIPVDCGPCFQRQCAPGHLRCLRELEPRRVITALDGLLADAN